MNWGLLAEILGSRDLRSDSDIIIEALLHTKEKGPCELAEQLEHYTIQRS